MSLLKAISNGAFSSSSSSSSFNNITSASSSFQPGETTDSGEAAVVFTVFLIIALLISILVSSINFFKSVTTLKKYTLTYILHIFSLSFFPQWMHESLAILIMGTLVGCIQNFIVNNPHIHKQSITHKRFYV